MAAPKTARKKAAPKTAAVEAQQGETPVEPSLTAEVTEAAPVTPDPAPEPESVEASARPIERIQSTGAWHCPYCDTANESKVTACKCGGVRDGDEVTR